MALAAPARASQAGGCTIEATVGLSLCAGGCLDSLLALFPLEVVLFPGTPLPLHIFEPRYRGNDRGVPGAEKGVRRDSRPGDGPRRRRAAPRNSRGHKEYDDGRMDIVAEGSRPVWASRSQPGAHRSCAGGDPARFAMIRIGPRRRNAQRDRIASTDSGTGERAAGLAGR